MFLGDVEIDKAYLGTDLVFSGGPNSTQIAYLQSSGTQYINLPVTCPKNSYFEVSGHVIGVHPNNNQYAIFGTSPYYCCQSTFYSYNSSTKMITFGSTVGNKATSGGWVASTESPTYFLLSTTKKISNGTETSWSKPLTAAITAFRLFGGYQNNNRYPIKICDFKVVVGDQTVLDLIPWRIGSVGYMYDRINDTYYGNNGTGNFILGPDV